MKSLKNNTQSQKSTQPQENGSAHRLLDTEHVPNLNGSGRPSLPDHCPLWGHSIFPVYGYMYAHLPHRPHRAGLRSAPPQLVHNRLLPGGRREGEDEQGHLPNTLHTWEAGRRSGICLGGGWRDFPSLPWGDILPLSQVFPHHLLTNLHICPRASPPRSSPSLRSPDRIKQRPPGRSPRKSHPSITWWERDSTLNRGTAAQTQQPPYHTSCLHPTG